MKYLRVVQKFILCPLKQAGIGSSDLSQEQFLHDSINGTGAEKSQLDFAKTRLSLKVNPTGNSLEEIY